MTVIEALSTATKLNSLNLLWKQKKKLKKAVPTLARLILRV